MNLGLQHSRDHSKVPPQKFVQVLIHLVNGIDTAESEYGLCQTAYNLQDAQFADARGYQPSGQDFCVIPMIFEEH
jgi:hypothetical protein